MHMHKRAYIQAYATMAILWERVDCRPRAKRLIIKYLLVYRSTFLLKNANLHICFCLQWAEI